MSIKDFTRGFFGFRDPSGVTNTNNSDPTAANKRAAMKANREFDDSNNGNVEEPEVFYGVQAYVWAVGAGAPAYHLPADFFDMIEKDYNKLGFMGPFSLRESVKRLSSSGIIRFAVCWVKANGGRADEVPEELAVALLEDIKHQWSELDENALPNFGVQIFVNLPNNVGVSQLLYPDEAEKMAEGYSEEKSLNIPMGIDEYMGMFNGSYSVQYLNANDKPAGEVGTELKKAIMDSLKAQLQKAGKLAPDLVSAGESTPATSDPAAPVANGNPDGQSAVAPSGDEPAPTGAAQVAEPAQADPPTDSAAPTEPAASTGASPSPEAGTTPVAEQQPGPMPEPASAASPQSHSDPDVEELKRQVDELKGTVEQLMELLTAPNAVAHALPVGSAGLLISAVGAEREVAEATLPPQDQPASAAQTPQTAESTPASIEHKPKPTDSGATSSAAPDVDWRNIRTFGM